MTVIGNISAAPKYFGSASDAEILALWRSGRDTVDIARTLGLPEWKVANRLPHILERARKS